MKPSTKLSPSEISDRLKGLPGWRLENGAIVRDYQTDGWPTTLMLVNAVGFYAEAADHHPDLEVHWGSVSVALSTHSAGGITPKDVALAKQVEQVALWQAGPPFRPAEKFVRHG